VVEIKGHDGVVEIKAPCSPQSRWRAAPSFPLALLHTGALSLSHKYATARPPFNPPPSRSYRELRSFYDTVTALFAGGNLGGLRVIARKPLGW